MKDKLICLCTEDYLFNKTDDFIGVQFLKDSKYKFCKPDVRIKTTRLVSVVNEDNKSLTSYVGMDIDRFNDHFMVLVPYDDVDNIAMCLEYGIRYDTIKF